MVFSDVECPEGRDRPQTAVGVIRSGTCFRGGEGAEPDPLKILVSAQDVGRLVDPSERPASGAFRCFRSSYSISLRRAW